MLFNSLVFIYAFLPITYLVFWRLHNKNQRYVWLTITGYVFYGFWNFRFCGLMAFSTLVSYCAGRGFLRWKDERHRRWCLVTPIVVDLLLLSVFKYAGFALDTVNSLAGWLGVPIHAPVVRLILPVGISFYTFHTITYIVDSYRGTIKPTRNLFEFSCYVSLFSQLVAGPIVRFRQIEADLERIGTGDRTTYLERGCSFFAIGMIEKVLIADSIANVIDPALLHYPQLSTPGAWLCMLGYTYQLFFDFAGYSDMAVGLGYLFGIRIPQNFNSPYKATDMSDFWRRWHISLSSCLRDYLYIPLGGNRGTKLGTYRNLMVTMLLGGLWHGANWTFVLWGGYHGLLLALYRATGRTYDRLPLHLRQGATFFLAVIGWVLFRSTNMAMLSSLLGKMFSWRPGPLPAGEIGLLAALLVAVPLAHWAPNSFEVRHDWRPLPALLITGLFVVCLAVLYAGRPSPFLYFQF